jgi:threonyl-tRNA synthetase
MIDHRRLGRELELFASDPLVGSGLPIWLPAGAAARHAIESYIREEERRAGYQHVYSPPLAKRAMYERSGHLAKFGDDMFPAMNLSPAATNASVAAASVADDGSAAGGAEELMLRPSLCPHHAMVFASRGRSYRELPFRVAELGSMFRAERSGVLGGLSRVRAISLNDAHNFCAPEQVGAEVADVLGLMARAHACLGSAPSSYRLSLRGNGSSARSDVDAGQSGFLGERADWDLAESLLREALVSAGVDFEEAPGEAAFYGPKIDVQIVDSGGRELSLATVQVDFLQPARFDLSYVDSSGSPRRPVMVHRSIVGSFERLFAHLIEVHEGAFPVWYAPVQVLVLPVGEAQADAARRLVGECLGAGLRAEALYDGSMGARIRDAALRKIPYVAVIGPREDPVGEVSLRLRDGSSLPARPTAEAVALIRSVSESRSLTLLP